MTDKPTPPAAPEPKDAVPAGTFTKPPAKQLTFSQQLGIWVLILVVGVVFGIGTPVSLLFGGQAMVTGDVSQAEIIPRMQTADHLERVLNPNGYGRRNIFLPPPSRDSNRAVAQDLQIARLAAGRGLMPKGQALDRIEADFLATPLPGSPGRTYHDALREHEGGADGVSREDLRRFLAERTAREGLLIRAAVPPVVPRDSGIEAYSAVAEQIEVTHVTLTGTRLLPAVKADDPEIPAAYQRLQTERFRRPVGVAINLAYIDREGFIKDIQVSDADAKAWYDGHQADYRDPKLGTPDKPVFKTFEQVKEEAATAVRNDRAAGRAEAVAERFSTAVDALDGEKDPAHFIDEAKKAGMQLEDLSVEDHTPGTIDLGKHGTLKDLIGLFGHDHDPGFISRFAQTSTGSWVVIRLVSRREAGFQDLEAVKPQVIRYLAGRRAWKPLLAEATRLRDQLKGPGALAAWAASEEGKGWDAKPATTQHGPTDPLRQPPAEADGQSGDPVVVARLTMPDRPLALAEAFQEGMPAYGIPDRLERFADDVPQIRLVQVTGIKPADLAGRDKSVFTDAYRNALGDYSEALLAREIQAQLEKR